MKASLPVCMRSWQLHAYAPKQMPTDWSEHLRLTATRRLPTMTSPCQVLVRVKAASLNSIDLHQMHGYGANTFSLLRCASNLSQFGSLRLNEFPMTPGRDFVGEICLSGPQAQQRGFQPGTWVVGATLPHMSADDAGAMSQFLVCSNSFLAKLPAQPRDESQIMQLAASPYAALTAWAALEDTARVKLRSPNSSLKVLVVGASGGVGLSALQLLREHCAGPIVLHATSAESEQAVERVREAGAEQIFTRPHKPPQDEASYDFVLDCVRPRDLHSPDEDWTRFVKPRTGLVVNLNSPLLHAQDEEGLVLGSIHSLVSLAKQRGRSRWAFFRPSPERLARLAQLIQDERFQIPIHQVFPFDSVPEAYNALAKGGVYGKILVKHF